MHTTQRAEASNSWYITTSIPYVNAQPHIGHALEYVQADVMARYRRAQGDPVRFQTGTDENALKNVRAAEQAGVPTAALVERNALRFSALAEALNLATDNFIRTSQDEHHRQGVHRFWRACAARGDIYKRTYSGLYCVGCEQFYDEGELADALCPVHAVPLESVAEENYFFRLSRYQAELLRLIEREQVQIVPETRRSEVLRFIRQGLRDFSISRSQARAHGWGIPVPDDPSQVIYVWFDALINYITGLAYGADGPLFQQLWQPGARQVHVIGKDIVRFHAIYWPAMLLSAGLPLPSTIFVHGFVTANGNKISKSRGNTVDPFGLVARYGCDAVRYYLLRKIPATGDGNFSEDELAQAYNGELADQLGNLVHRVVKMIERYCDGIVPTPGALAPIDRDLYALAEQVERHIHAEMEHFAFHKALSALWMLIAAANKYVVETEPWVLARQRGDDPHAAARLQAVLHVLVEMLGQIAQLLAPFLPATAQGIAAQIGAASFARGSGRVAHGATVQDATPLFPKERIPV